MKNLPELMRIFIKKKCLFLKPFQNSFDEIGNTMYESIDIQYVYVCICINTCTYVSMDLHLENTLHHVDPKMKDAKAERLHRTCNRLLFLS